MQTFDEIVYSSKILIVDDNSANIALLEMMLSAENYTNIKSTTDPSTVMDLYNKEKFDLILLDIRMPVMSGLDVIKLLHDKIEEDDYLPILVLTAQHELETKLEALELGATDFVTKPFNNTEVLNRIKNILLVKAFYNQRKNYSEILEDKVKLRTKELTLKNEELKNARLEIIQYLGRAAEYRDNETGFHVIRVSKYCKLLAQAIGLPDEKVELIYHASPMHDVGKIGISDTILLKPGKLTPEERKIIETHTEIGAEILKGNQSELMKLARIIAQSHHEKWDGTGYPNNLAGESIPIAGRILAICDVFDALTFERPYKQAWSIESAVEYLKQNSGLHFDPKLVTAFMNHLPEILAIRNEFLD